MAWRPLSSHIGRMSLTGRSSVKNSLDVRWRHDNRIGRHHKKHKRLKLISWALCAFCGFFLVSCSGKPVPTSTTARTFKLGLTGGAQEFVDFVMEGHGMLDQVGLKADKVKSLSPANLHLMLAERKVDIGFGGFTTMATARSQGKDIIVIYGVFSPVNMVFVSKNSPIRSLKDLRGRKLGVFGGPGSTTFTFLS